MVRNAAGASNPYLIAYARAPVVLDNGANNTPENDQPVPVPCEVAGRVERRRDRDRYSFNAKKGYVLVIEVQGSRLGPSDGWFRKAVAQTRFAWETARTELDSDGDGSVSRPEFGGPDEARALPRLHDAQTFAPFVRPAFITDDLVQISDSGEIALTGRASELINTAGKKVNPREVEQVLLQLDGVRQAKVYGAPAGARGEVVAAAVVASPDVTREAVREFCRARLSPHKVPRIVKLIDAIPVDDRGKVRRAALAEL